MNFCLIPEVPFTLEGCSTVVRERLQSRGHAVIVVAEGAGQDLIGRTPGERDASGNVKFGDIGLFLRDRIQAYLQDRSSMEVTLKYIDPSYTIRSVPANAHDSAFCLLLGHNAVHAGMAGPHQHGRRLLENTIHPRADPPGGLAAQEGRPAGLGLEQRPDQHRSARGHAIRSRGRVPFNPFPCPVKVPSSERRCSRSATLLLAVVLLGGAWPGAGRAQPSAAAIGEKIRNCVVAGQGHAGGVGISSIPILSQLYRKNGHQPLWVDPETLDQLFKAIYAVNDDGLDPADYHLGDLLRLRAALRGAGRTNSDAASDFDLLLTDSFIRLTYHLSYGKANPRSLNPAWGFGSKISDRDPVPLLLAAIHSGKVFDFLDGLKPQVPYYLRLRTALAVYRDLQRGGGWGPIPEHARFVKGERSPDVALLRKTFAYGGFDRAGR